MEKMCIGCQFENRQDECRTFRSFCALAFDRGVKYSATHYYEAGRQDGYEQGYDACEWDIGENS